MLGIETPAQVARDPLYGNLVENLVFLELMKSRLNQGRDPRLYYYRDVSGHEVDFLFQSGHELVPIEVKGARTFNTDFLKNLQKFQEIAANRCRGGAIIYAGSQEQSVGDFSLLNYRQAPDALLSRP